MKAHVFLDRQATLGEGVFWDEKRKWIFHLDILGKKIYAHTLQGEKKLDVAVPKMPACMVLDQGDNLVIAAEDQLYYLDLETLMLIEGRTFPEIPFPLRFNDGKCDAKGRLVAGTMYRDQELDGAKEGAALFSITEKETTLLQDRQTIANGLAWSADNRTLYHIDTPTGNVYAYPYDLSTGEVGTPTVCIHVDPAEGSPDGMCIDAEGQLWIALWGGYKVARYHPDTGKKTAEIGVDAECVSCCAFGGPELDTLYITTAKNDKGQGGQLFACNTKTKGILPFSYQRE